MTIMKNLIPFAVCFCLAALPASAQDTSPMHDETSPQIEEGMGLMERGARLFLRGLMEEVDPAMEDLKDFAENIQPNLQLLMDEMGPALQNLADLMDSATSYKPPERLPNGDIIIRRKLDAPELPPEGEIDI